MYTATWAQKWGPQPLTQEVLACPAAGSLIRADLKVGHRIALSERNLLLAHGLHLSQGRRFPSAPPALGSVTEKSPGLERNQSLMWSHLPDACSHLKTLAGPGWRPRKPLVRQLLSLWKSKGPAQAHAQLSRPSGPAIPPAVPSWPWHTCTQSQALAALDAAL